MGTISKMVQYRIELLRQKQMKLAKLMQPGWGDVGDYFHERDKKYGMTKVKFLPVIQTHTADDAASTAPMTFDEPMETHDSIPRQLVMPQVTSGAGSSHMRLGSQKPQTHECTLSLPPDTIPEWSQIQKSKHVEPVCFNPSISCLKLITI